jgi:hypothetical protein
LKVIGSAVFGVDEGDAGGGVSLEVVPELDDRVKDGVFLRPTVNVIKLFFSITDAVANKWHYDTQ